MTHRDLESFGLTRTRVRSPDIEAAHWGIYVPTGAAVTPLDHARAVARLDQHTVICRVTAAQWMDARLPVRWQRAEQVHLARTGGKDRPRRSWVQGTRVEYGPREVLVRDGVRVTTPARTFLDLAPLLDEEELVVIGDGFVCRHESGPLAGIPSLCSIEDIWAVLAAHPGYRGIRRARAAVDRLRVGSDSAPETRLRLRLEDLGITDLVLDFRLAAPDGWEVVPDLWHGPSRCSIQYDGAHHADQEQMRRDVERARRTASAGAHEVRIMQRDMTILEEFRGLRLPRAVRLVVEAIERRTGTGFGAR